MKANSGASWTEELAKPPRHLRFALQAAGLITGFVPLLGAAGFQMLIRFMEIVALYSRSMAVNSSDQPSADLKVLASAQLIISMLGFTGRRTHRDALGCQAVFGLAAAISGIALIGTLGLLRRARRMVAIPD